jgi:zinc/manganese transport system permease protein
MFSGPMTDAWVAATIVALVAGFVGFFTVLRGSAFAAHALPAGAFSGAAGAGLIGVSAILGLGVFSVAGALLIGGLGRRARHDVAVALTVVTMFGLGALFLSMTTEYAPQLFSLLFGEVLGVSANEIAPTAAIGTACIAVTLLLFRPLLLSSVMPEVAEARGIGARRTETVFLILLALATSAAVPVVGALLIFSLLIGPAATARCFTRRPSSTLALSVVIAVVTVWASIAASYLSNLPIGFFVGLVGAVGFAVGRCFLVLVRKRSQLPRTASALQSFGGVGS